MAKLFLLLGIILMIGGFAWLFIFVAGPDVAASNPTISGFMSSVFCQSGETLRQEYGPYVSGTFGRGGGRSVEFYCVNGEGDERDVTGNSVLIGIGGFAAPFIGGLLMTIIAGTAMAAGATRRLTQSMLNPVFSNARATSMPGQTGFSATVIQNGQQVPLTPEMAQQVQQALGGVFDNMQNLQNVQGQLSSFNSAAPQQTSGGDLVSRLRQLDDARNAGLLSADEYDRLRKEILDNLKD
ncbi:MAG: SHOCT domain-containing protein [Chloroflexi bacterium]|nr:SHOCT domain-containing protein [Chloroflexota bacterium]